MEDHQDCKRDSGMRWSAQQLTRHLSAANTFDPRSCWLAVSRSLLALATFSVLAATSDSVLFPANADTPTGMRCFGVHRASLWCFVEHNSTGILVVRYVTMLALLIVASGYRPRWTCLPHCYITASLTLALPLPSGAESIAQIATILLVPLCLGDRRQWQWQPPRAPISPTWAGAAYAAWLAVRVQITIIYAEAAISKLQEGPWRAGSAMFTVINDPTYHPPSAIRNIAIEFVSYRSLAAVLTWGVLATELTIAVCALGPHLLRRIAFALSILLHVGIIVTLGLFAFGIVMIGLVTLALIQPSRRRSPPEQGVPVDEPRSGIVSGEYVVSRALRNVDVR